VAGIAEVLELLNTPDDGEGAVLLTLVPKPPKNVEALVDVVVFLLLSPSHNGFSASFKGAGRLKLLAAADLVLGATNVNGAGSGRSSGFANADDLAKKFGTPVLVAKTAAGAGAVGVGAGTEAGTSVGCT